MTDWLKLAAEICHPAVPEIDEGEGCCIQCQIPIEEDGSNSAGPDAFSGWGIGPICRECYREVSE